MKVILSHELLIEPTDGLVLDEKSIEYSVSSGRLTLKFSEITAASPKVIENPEQPKPVDQAVKSEKKEKKKPEYGVRKCDDQLPGGEVCGEEFEPTGGRDTKCGKCKARRAAEKALLHKPKEKKAKKEKKVKVPKEKKVKVPKEKKVKVPKLPKTKKNKKVISSVPGKTEVSEETTGLDLAKSKLKEAYESVPRDEHTTGMDPHVLVAEFSKINDLSITCSEAVKTDKLWVCTVKCLGVKAVMTTVEVRDGCLNGSLPKLVIKLSKRDPNRLTESNL
jgi:hypothetical protein